jgi:hypothetical protein
MSDKVAIRMKYAAIWRRVSIDSVAVCIVSLFFALYGGDYLVLRYRMVAHLDGATSSVTIFYAAPIKGGKVRLFSDQPQVQTCVRSIFPWRGYQPCWYLKRHAIKIVS